MDNSQKPIHPLYFRKSGKCVRVDTPTTTWTIILPPESKVPYRYPSTYPTQDRLQEELRGFEEVSFEVFKSFLFTYYQLHATEREQTNEALEIKRLNHPTA